MNRLKDIFWYSDSEPNEVLISFCHMVCLPLSICYEFGNPNFLFIAGAVAAGVFQFWAVALNGSLKMRLIAVQAAALIAVITCVNLGLQGLLTGSRTGWIMIAVFALWNMVRVFNEKLHRNG